MSLNKLNISDAILGLKNKDFTAKELVQDHIDQIEKHNKDLNLYITTTFEKALEQAEESDKKILQNEARALEGIPIGIKDLYCTKDVLTTAGSKMLGNFIPTYESTVTSKLREAGTISLGKLNLDEFAMGSANMTSYFGNAISPWKNPNMPNEKIVPGGSSGGSSGAVSAFMCMGATGTDTGGSIRQPAAFTGVVGMKPSYGRCSRWGVVAFASSLDQPGMFGRSVKDTAMLMESIMGYDPKDSTSVNMEVPNLSQMCNSDVRGKTIGLPRDLFEQEGIDGEVLQMWQKSLDILKQEGCKILDITLPNAKHGLATYYIIGPAEASSNLARYDGVKYGHRTQEIVNSIDELYALTRAEGFGPEVKRRIMIGTYVLSADEMESYYVKAQKIRRLIVNDFQEAFKKVDAILLPSAPTEAFSTNIKQDNPVTMYLNDIFTIPVSLAGLPGISVPVSYSKNHLPLGMQVVGNNFDEANVIQLAAALERNINMSFDVEGY